MNAPLATKRRPVARPKRCYVSTRVTKKQLTDLDNCAERFGLTRSNMVLKLLMDMLSTHVKRTDAAQRVASCMPVKPTIPGDTHTMRARATRSGRRHQGKAGNRSAPARDTGWKLLTPGHVPRFHRVVGNRELDVEPQVSTWLGSSRKAGVFEALCRGHRTQQEAAEAIERRVGVAGRRLPALR